MGEFLSAGALLLAVIAAYVVTAYLVLPLFWRHYEHNRSFEAMPKTTRTVEGIPGDPLNVSLVGTNDELLGALLSAGWHPADPITFRNAVKVAERILLNRPYLTAPVSDLFLWDRREDLAFEQAVGNSPRERHHVRFWRSDHLAPDGRPVWVGAATFDRKVGMSRYTGQIIHRVFPDIDGERDKLIDDLRAAGRLAQIYQVTGIGPTLSARNGEGDRYYTDGEVTVGVLAPRGLPRTPEFLPNPAPIDMKNTLWRRLRRLLGGRKHT